MVLSVKSELELREVGDKLRAADIPHIYIHEPDAPYFGQLTAIGLAPTTDRSRVKRVLSSLPLYGKKESELCEAV